jgi:hypothetical protein
MPILVFFGRPWDGKFLYIARPFGIFPILVCSNKKIYFLPFWYIFILLYQEKSGIPASVASVVFQNIIDFLERVRPYNTKKKKHFGALLWFHLLKLSSISSNFFFKISLPTLCSVSNKWAYSGFEIFQKK